MCDFISFRIFTNWVLQKKEGQKLELMCDANDFAIGAILGHQQDKHFHPIYYASQTLTGDQKNKTTTEKELLVVVFAFDKNETKHDG